MAKINRQKLAKGTFLKSNKINEFVNEVKTAVNNGTLDDNNVQFLAPTRLVFNTRCFKANPNTSLTYLDTDLGGNPGVHGDLGHWTDATGAYAAFPNGTGDINLWQHFLFTLPEPQENFDVNGIMNENTKNFSLSELAISADNLHNPASIYPNNTSADGGYHQNSLSGTDSMEIVVVIHRKTASRKSSTYHWEEQIGSWTIPFTTFLDGSLSRNPFLFEGLNIKFAPDSIYLLSIGFPDKTPVVDNSVTNFTNFIIMNNVQISLKFLSELRANDTVSQDGGGVMTVQNAPIRQVETTSITTSDIAADAVITEATIQDNIEKLDEAAHRKLVGSYDDHGNFPNKPQIIGSSYGIQQVPLFNNNGMLWNWTWDGARMSMKTPGVGNSLLWMPYSGNPGPLIPSTVPAGATTVCNFVADRKFIPIHQPMTIHHILLTYWTGSPLFLTGKRTTNANTKFEVAVILHTFGRGDTISRHQIAEAEFQPVTGTDTRTGNNIIVDEAIWLEQQNHPSTINSTKDRCGFTVQIPVNHGATAAGQGKGYVVTGPPIFVGQGEYGPTAGRSNSRTGIYQRTQDNTIVNYTKGCEQAIEVIVRIKNEADGIGVDVFKDDPGGGSFDASVKVQQPGMMMYLIGKTPLQNPRW
tara:strand:+ start:12117 stop:14033 length:1917 start_codon:yes stop_codon:yes gene_type:complete